MCQYCAVFGGTPVAAVVPVAVEVVAVAASDAAVARDALRALLAEAVAVVRHDRRCLLLP